MEVKEFIKNKLEDLSKEFQEIKFSYVFDEEYTQHIIEVNPISEYKLERFSKNQIDFEMEFIKQFPDAEIMFLTEGHELTLPEFEFTISGQNFIENSISELLNKRIDILKDAIYSNDIITTNLYASSNEAIKSVVSANEWMKSIASTKGIINTVYSSNALLKTFSDSQDVLDSFSSIRETIQSLVSTRKEISSYSFIIDSINLKKLIIDNSHYHTYNDIIKAYDSKPILKSYNKISFNFTEDIMFSDKTYTELNFVEPKIEDNKWDTAGEENSYAMAA